MDGDKRTFFRALDALDKLIQDDSVDDFLTLVKTGQKQKSFSLLPNPVESAATKSIVSADASRTQRDEVNKGKPPHQPTRNEKDGAQDQLKMKRRSHQLSDNATSATGKRKRIEPLRMKPEAQQIFKGLTFFYIPNNDVNPTRGLRIQRAREYGAVWAQTWSAEVTHVIVDKKIAFQSVLKILNVDSLPNYTNVVVVNDDYPSECLHFGQLLDASRFRFRVEGAPTEDRQNPPGQATGARYSVEPLPLKSARREQRTPTPDFEDSEVRDTEFLATEPANRRAPSPEPSRHRSRDQLDEIVERVKGTRDLPFDANDQDPADDCFDDGEQASAEATSVTEVPQWQQKFSCMRKHDGKGHATNPNARTIELLQEMASYYERTADHWRTISYRKAISALRQQTTHIKTKAQALAIQGIGERLADKIEEIVTTGRLQRLENTSLTPEDRALQLFLSVYGVGIAQASRWVARGLYTLEDLKTKADLTRNQRIGVERYDDFRQRIPREEVAAHEEIVRQAVQEEDPDMQTIIAGSYRRGAPTSGDIDVIITKPGATVETIRSLVMETVVPKLVRQGFIKASLATSSRNEGSKWHGASALPDRDVWRRIDLLFVPGDEIGAALLYFTGNDIFNRSIRLLASKKGMCLNQHGLYKNVLRGAQRVKANQGCLVEGRDERRIFEILGVPWRPPEHRNC